MFIFKHDLIFTHLGMFCSFYLGLNLLLTHISLSSFLWDIGKQNSPRLEAAFCGVPSGAIQFADMIFIEK